jgi:hypothetical protein
MGDGTFLGLRELLHQRCQRTEDLDSMGPNERVTRAKSAYCFALCRVPSV